MAQDIERATAPSALDAAAADTAAAADYEVNLKSLSQFELVWRKFRRHRLALIGLGIMAFLFLVAIFGPIFAPYAIDNIPDAATKAYEGLPPLCADYAPGTGANAAKFTCKAYGLVHPFGTTGGLQWDVMTLVINGARTSLLIGFSSMAIGVILGTIIGAIAGYLGGFVDNLLMRVVDVMLSLPLLFVILVISRFFKDQRDNVWQIIIIFGVFSWMGVSRLVRSLFLSIREREFVEAAKAVGVRDRRIIFRHILPNALSPIVVAASLIVAGNIIGEAFVSFLGYGVNPYTPTWGNILSNSLTFLLVGNWWWPAFPGLAIILTVLAVNFVGDGLRDAFDPRTRA